MDFENPLRLHIRQNFSIYRELFYIWISTITPLHCQEQTQKIKPPRAKRVELS